ncbi:hypothetical protein [Bradyrhizobium sp. Ash2021]|uniref:hypothetical protein n=1 Tax=Bradyrhizobium sp. Ash2021 TaxID=2954771 RepID=UPI0028165B86|nr:hypothetical protein [Bradyrhizobium sp. Ash2021]WMT76263.1 hypothetical protein NL528_07785 [Bradyrhizobium sp. Ash2021]
MKLFTGWVVAAGLALAATGAQAQLPAPHVGYTAVSDVSGPYAAMPPEAPVARYGHGPTLLPPMEVYTVVREAGFSPLGIPQQRGVVYTISVIDRGGDDGKLVIDARTGRIIRFMPADRMGDNFNEDLNITYGAPGPLPPIATVRGVPRPPRPIPHVASRTVPVPKASPLAARPAPEPAQQAAAVAKSAETPPAPTVGQAKPPAPSILPTQEMPAAQGLE